MPNFCTKCGHRVMNAEEDIFCSNCGASLRKLVMGIDRGSGAGSDEEGWVPSHNSSCRCSFEEEEEEVDIVPKRSASFHKLTLPPPPPPGRPRIDTAERVALTILTRQHSFGGFSRLRSFTTQQEEFDANDRRDVPKSRSYSEVDMHKEDALWLDEYPISLYHEKTGWLNRQGHDILGQWKKRWFKLACGILFHFSKPLDEKALGSIPLTNSYVEVLKRHPKKFTFRIMIGTLDGKSHTLQAESIIDLNHWVESLVIHGAKVYNPEEHNWKSLKKGPIKEKEEGVLKSPKSLARSTEPSVEEPGSPPKSQRTSPLIERMLTRAYSAPSHQKAIAEIAEDMKSKVDLSKKKERSSSSSALVVKKNFKRDIVISAPTLKTQPKPIVSIPKKLVSELSLDEPNRDLLFSPQSRAKIVKYQNHSQCGTCGYRTAYFMTFCGSCGARFMGIENAEGVN